MGPAGPLLLINGLVRSLCYIRRMGHVIVCPTCCILGRASCTNETLSDFC